MELNMTKVTFPRFPRYDPARGGYLGGYALDEFPAAFVEAVEAFRDWQHDEPEWPSDFLLYTRINDICQALFNSPDIMPDELCASFGDFDEALPSGSSYAEGACRLKILLLKMKK